REVAERDPRFDRHGPGRGDNLARLARAALCRPVTGALPLPLAGPAAALVDDDAAPALGPAAARPDRSVRLSVRHRSTSVEARERWVDAEVRRERAIERPPGDGALEALQAPTRVGAPARAGTRYELAALPVEALQLALGCLAAAAGARANRV